MILGRHLCLMQGLFDIRQSFVGRQIGSGEIAPYILNSGVVWRMATSYDPLLDRHAIFNSYEAGWASASVSTWLYRRVCFYGKLTVLLPYWSWLLYRAALFNDICSSTAPRRWRNAGFCEIISSLSNMKLPVDSGIMWPYTASTDKQISRYRPFRGASHYNLQSKNVRNTLLRFTTRYYVNSQNTLIASISPC